MSARAKVGFNSQSERLGFVASGERDPGLAKRRLRLPVYRGGSGQGNADEADEDDDEVETRSGWALCVCACSVVVFFAVLRGGDFFLPAGGFSGCNSA
jgi:hypothetical protein